MNPTSSNKITGFNLLSADDANKDKHNIAINAAYHSSIDLMQRAGICCKLPMKTINTAIMIFLRYFVANDMTQTLHDKKQPSLDDICLCALFSATKIEESHCRLRDIMNATFKVRHPHKKVPNPNTRSWHDWKERLITLESIILNAINFEFNAVHPHQFVLHQCNELKTSVSIAKLAWSICNDVMYSRHVVLYYEPHQISAAAIYVAIEFHNNYNSNHNMNRKHNTSNYSKHQNDPQGHNMNKHNHNHSGNGNGSNEVDEEEDEDSDTSPNYGNSASHHQCVLELDATKEPYWWRRFDIDEQTIENIASLIMDLYESPYVQFEAEEEKKNNVHCTHELDVDVDNDENEQDDDDEEGEEEEEREEEEDEDDDLLKSASPSVGSKRHVQNEESTDIDEMDQDDDIAAM